MHEVDRLVQGAIINLYEKWVCYLRPNGHRNPIKMPIFSISDEFLKASIGLTKIDQNPIIK